MHQLVDSLQAAYFFYLSWPTVIMLRHLQSFLTWASIWISGCVFSLQHSVTVLGIPIRRPSFTVSLGLPVSRVTSLVLTRLDYCNATLAGFLLFQLLSAAVTNAASQLVSER